MATIEAALKERMKTYRADFPALARSALRIKTKAGELGRFRLNRAQQHMHECLERQKRETGKVRALVLKGRQQGASTYIGGRFYGEASLNRGRNVFILTHEQDATDNLFKMVDRFHTNNPIAPETGAANAKELSFPGLDSGYTVGTAGSRAVGRSKTIHCFHGSEVAFWPNAKGHFAGVVQAVPDLPGTEVILESTANGMSGEFFERWQRAEAGVGDYIAIFVPWFWQDEYSRDTPADWSPTEEELTYQEAHGLTDGQMVWRRAKIAELGDPLLFMQEYPATASEAFQTTGIESYIPAALVLAARKKEHEPAGPLIMGADPARFGDDRFALVRRRGRKVFGLEKRKKLNAVDGANWLRDVIDKEDPAKMFIDVGDVGAAIVDMLHSWGEKYERIVVGVNFGGSPRVERDEGGPLNRRAEMWEASKDWLEQEGGVDLPDSDELQADATGPTYGFNMKQKLKLESKEAMRARGVRSPDLWDGVVLTFAEPVHERQHGRSIYDGQSGSRRGWMT